jgi:hypothetical protein
MKTYQEVLDEFLNLRNDDPDFENQWSIHQRISMNEL